MARFSMPRLSLAATILRNTWRATMERLRWPRKHGMTKCLKLIRRRWRNTLVNARSSLTGLKPTGRSKLRRIKTSQTLITRSSFTIPRLQIIDAHSAEILGHVSAKLAAETGRASFCRRRRACAWLRCFSFPLNFFCA